MDTEPYYGAPQDSNIQTLGQRLREYYAPEDFVTVINIDTAPLKYQFATPTDVETFSNYPGHKDTILKQPPQVVILQPGETKLCPAYEADLMIENLIKQITSRVAHNQAAADGVRFRSANWTDPDAQEHFIKQIFLGKKDLVHSFNESNKSDVEKDLDTSGKSGRPKTTV